MGHISEVIMNKDRKMTVIIGASRFGAAIASLNSEEGIYTSIIDSDEKSFRKLESNYSGFKIIGDAMNTQVLEKANIQDATEIDICTSDDNINIYLAFWACRYTQAEHIIVRLHDDVKAILLKDKRITVITPSRLSFGMYTNIRKKQNEESDSKNSSGEVK